MEPFVRRGDDRPRDRLNRLEPRNPFKDPRVLMRALPGLAEQFRVQVPDSLLHAACDVERRVEGVRVACAMCGSGTRVVPVGDFVECEGCHTWYLNTGVSVRVARFEEDF